VPFQILCAAAMLRLLNTYASSATQAKGQIWSEVSRHAIFLVILIVAAAVGSRWGLEGVALGVLGATAVMTVLLQSLTRTLGGLTWQDMLAPQLPAIVCSGSLGLVLLATKTAVRTAFGGASALPLLLVCVAVAAIFYLAFVLFGPFVAVKRLVHESARDLAPWVADRIAPIAPSQPEVASS
jgi:hypothetical protein